MNGTVRHRASQRPGGQRLLIADPTLAESTLQSFLGVRLRRTEAEISEYDRGPGNAPRAQRSPRRWTVQQRPSICFLPLTWMARAAAKRELGQYLIPHNVIDRYRHHQPLAA